MFSSVEGRSLFCAIFPEGIVTIGMLLNMAVALTVSKRTPAPPDDVQRIIEQIRAPNHPGPPLDI